MMESTSNPLTGLAKGETIIIISHVLPFPPAAGNETRILKMINWFRSIGFKVVYLLNADRLPVETRRDVLTVVDRIYCKSEPLPYTGKLLRKLNNYLGRDGRNEGLGWLRNVRRRRSIESSLSEAEIRKRSLAPHGLIKAARFLVQKYSPCAVIGEYVFTAPCLQALRSSRMIKFIDTHDLFCRRPEEEWVYCTPQEEREYLMTADVVIAIQPEEAREFQALVPERQVITVGVDYPVEDRVDSSRAVPGRLLVVGSDNQANVRGLQDFMYHAWPTIRSKSTEVRLRIVGKIGEHFCDEDARVDVVGWVRNVQEEYRGASVVINPTCTGTGLKLKTVEALCHGKPLVTTANGIGGLPLPKDPPWIVGDNWRDFAGHVIRLLEDGDERQRLQDGALKFARELFAPEKVYSELARVLEELIGRK
jgi:glycosyltransferase involved in cell wall biosynthesis